MKGNAVEAARTSLSGSYKPAKALPTSTVIEVTNTDTHATTVMKPAIITSTLIRKTPTEMFSETEITTLPRYSPAENSKLRSY
jgi:hypothetical protein